MCFGSSRLQRLSFPPTPRHGDARDLMFQNATPAGKRASLKRTQVSADMSSVPESIQDFPTRATALEAGQLARRIWELGEWFHNFDLHGVPTAPHHFLGDFPNIKWRRIAKAIPDDLTGASVLDVGCDKLPGEFDYVLFMGLFYHLRYPLLALDNLIKKVAGKLVFQTMVRGSARVQEWADDYPIWNTQIFEERDFPAMYFIEKSYSNDPTNWWIPNCAAVEGMLRSSGLAIEEHPEPETWICSPVSATRQGKFIVDHELQGTL